MGTAGANGAKEAACGRILRSSHLLLGRGGATTASLHDQVKEPEHASCHSTLQARRNRVAEGNQKHRTRNEILCL